MKSFKIKKNVLFDKQIKKKQTKIDWATKKI